MQTHFLQMAFLIVVFQVFNACQNKSEYASENKIELSVSDIEGQWALITIDTVISKQSIEVNKKYNNTVVEYETSLIEPVDGVIKCVTLCPNYVPVKTIEFANDSVFEYSFPTHLTASNKIDVFNNVLAMKGNNSIWSKIESNIHISLNANLDSLRLDYLEHTGLFLSEVYKRTVFDQELVSFLRTYQDNLPYAQGKYGLVRYDFESVDYDSPFEHFHSFPHKIPESLDLSEDDLLHILKNDYEIQLLTDGELKPYDLSWSWGDRFWLHPKSWYKGPDTSAFIIYDKLK